MNLLNSSIEVFVLWRTNHGYRYLISFVLFIASPSLYAAPPPLSFVHLDIEELSASSAILQDTQGFIWFASNTGLYRYDGYLLRQFKADSRSGNTKFSLPSNTVNDLFEDEQKRLWIATPKGLAIFQSETETFKTYIPDINLGDSLKQRQIRKITSDAKGGLWLATREGLQHFDPNTKEFYIYRHDPKNSDSLARDNIDTFVRDAKGGLWIATWPGGFDYLPVGSDKFQHYQVTPEAISSPQNNVRALFIDSQKRLWIGTEVGIYRVNNPKRLTVEKPEFISGTAGIFGVRQFIENPSGIIWGNSTVGLLRWNPDKQQFDLYQHDRENPNSLPENHVTSLLAGKMGSLWVATNYRVSRVDNTIQGIERLIPRTLHGIDKNSSNNIRAISKTQSGMLWLGGPSSLMLVDMQKRAVIRTISREILQKSGLSKYFFSLYADTDGVLWIGARNGLFKLTKAGFQRIKLGSTANDFVNKIIPGREGVLWLGTGNGLIKYSPKYGVLQRFQHDPYDTKSLQHDTVTVLMLDNANRLWLSGSSVDAVGLSVINTMTGKVQYHELFDENNLEGLLSNTIQDIKEDSEGHIWLATDQGISRVLINKNGKIKFKNFQLGNIQAILFDRENKLWLNAEKSYIRFDPKSEEVESFALVGDSQVNFLSGISEIGNKGKLYFVSPNSLTIIDPSQVINNHNKPQVVLTEISLFNQSIEKSVKLEGVNLEGGLTHPKKITLPASKAIFSFRFSALDYSNPELNQYKYKLEGFDQDWIMSDSYIRLASYTNLDPGEYIFRVIASNNNDIWNTQGISFPISITPAYWQTLWFRGLILGAMLIFIVAIYLWRIRDLKLAQARLEKTIDQRTQQLKIKNEEALEAIQIKNQFIANMSHEIRTPMNAIIGMTELTLRTELTEKQRNYQQKVSSTSKWLLGVINDILDFSKLESGKLQLELVEFQFDSVIQYLKDMSASLSINKSISVSFDIDNVPPILIGDSLRLGQILLNLLSNAIKFTETGIVTLQVRCVHVDAQQVSLHFSVIDTGIGMNEAQLSYLFDAFMQADSSTTRKYGGTGLGLSICQNLVTEMGGVIAVESELGLGSQFCFNLNFKLPDISLLPEPLHSATDKKAVSLNLNNISLLVVDDNYINQEIMVEILSHAGAHVDISSNGQESIAMIKEHKYAAILMDCLMPIMDGYEATRFIREIPEYSELPIIAMTANASDDDRQRCLDCGMNDYIGKPVNLESLFQILARWIKGVENMRLMESQEGLESWGKLAKQLPGFNINQIMEILKGNQARFLQLLASFRKRYIQEVHVIENAIKAENYTQAAQALHALKGNSGNLGMIELYQITVSLESEAIKGHYNKVTLNHWLEVMSKVIGILNSFQNDEINSVPDKWPVFFAELADLLNNDAFVNDVFVQQLQAYALTLASEPAEKVNLLVQAILEGDYPQALIYLELLRKGDMCK